MKTVVIRRFLLVTCFLGQLISGCSKKSTGSVHQNKPSSKTINKIEENEVTSVEMDSIAMQAITVSGIAFESSQKNLIRIIGKPDSIRSGVNEFNGDRLSYYYFGKSYFEFHKDKVIGFSIADAKFYFSESIRLRVGDRAEILQTPFPASFSSRYALEDNIEIVKVSIGSSDEYILFKISNNRIIWYGTWVNW